MVVVVVVVIVCPVEGFWWVSLLIVGDVYDVGPLNASSVGLDMDVGFVEVPVDDKPLVLLETFEGVSAARELLGSLLDPEAEPPEGLSCSGCVVVWSGFLTEPLPPRMSFNRFRVPLVDAVDIVM